MPDKIELKEVSFAYGPVPVLRNVSITVERGAIVLIGGRSGHGMSTLLEICVGLLHPKTGNVFWDGYDCARMSKAHLLRVRQSVGFMFQTGALISNYTVFDNIALPLRNRSRMSAEAVEKRVRYEMENLMLVDIDTYYPEALSVFQCKAAALARAMISDPDMLFIDDPVGGMDQQTARGLLNIIEERWKKKRMGIVMITHDLDPWPHLPVRRFVLEGGVLSHYTPDRAGTINRTGNTL
jgi:phospholipid/cholesterol/gamma-HCH transport system ATP-binding protein